MEDGKGDGENGGVGEDEGAGGHVSPPENEVDDGGQDGGYDPNPKVEKPTPGALLYKYEGSILGLQEKVLNFCEPASDTN
eukprot:Nk52_evm1s2553 gene=Nk52_evmTU1s2553